MLKAGRLRDRIELQQPTESRDTHGGVSKSWTTYARVWASVEPLSGRERFLAEQVKAELSHRVVLRPGPDVQVGHRVHYRDKRGRQHVLDINAVLEIALDQTDLICAEGV